MKVNQVNDAFEDDLICAEELNLSWLRCVHEKVFHLVPCEAFILMMS